MYKIKQVNFIPKLTNNNFVCFPIVTVIYKSPEGGDNNSITNGIQTSCACKQILVHVVRTNPTEPATNYLKIYSKTLKKLIRAAKHKLKISLKCKRLLTSYYYHSKLFFLWCSL